MHCVVLLLYRIKRNITGNLNINKYNGASLLGLRNIVIKSHGNASAKSFEVAIDKAIKEIEYNIPHKIKSKIEKIIKQI